MHCVKCLRLFRGGERRFKYSAGWICQGCLTDLMQTPSGSCWGGCGKIIEVEEPAMLADVVTNSGQITGRYIHKACMVERR